MTKTTNVSMTETSVLVFHISTLPPHAFLHFGETKGAAIKRYREFVEKGIKQGTREDLHGGGLIRSAGGDVSELLGRKAEEREKGDATIL